MAGVAKQRARGLSVSRRSLRLNRSKQFKRSRLCGEAAEAERLVLEPARNTGLTEEFLRSRGIRWSSVNLAELVQTGRRALVAGGDGIASGKEVLRVPLHSGLVSLSQVFNGEDDVAEFLTSSKLSELACLALLLMYEKVSRTDSEWFPLISELDLARARGLEACETPILWPEHERERLLQGSPLAALTRSRIAGIKKEYAELDQVWWHNNSLFNSYPFAPPTEQFSVDTFRQAFAAIQSCCVHLRGENVSLANRFAVVPLGPPLMAFDPKCKAALQPDDEGDVVLRAGRDYKPGEPLEVWSGPQPNARLLLNYGFAELDNPHDRVTIRSELDSSDSLYRFKRSTLAASGKPSMSEFDVRPERPLPEGLLPFLRVCVAQSEDEARSVELRAGQEVDEPLEGAVSGTNERMSLAALVKVVDERLRRYPHSLAETEEEIKTPGSPRAYESAKLKASEMRLLNELRKACLIDNRVAELAMGSISGVLLS